MFKYSSEAAGAISLGSSPKHGWLGLWSAVPELVRRAAKQRSRATARRAMSFETLESRMLLSVDNIAPTATLTGPSSVDENQAATFTFSNPVDDAGDLSAGLRYSLDFTNDGVFDIVDSSSPDLIVPAYTLNGPSTVTVLARVSDIDGGFTDYTSTLTVTNSAPTLNATVLAPVYEGGSARIGFSNIIDSSSDLAAKLTFSLVDPVTSTLFTPYWNTTTVNSVTTIDAGVTIRAANLADGPATTSFTIRATDQNGATTDIVVPVQVLDVPPTIALVPANGSSTINQFATFTLKIAATDPGQDTISSYLISWGDGSDPQTVLPANAASVPHVYTQMGRFVVSVTASNEDGSYSRGHLLTANVDPAYGTNGVATPTNGVRAITSAVGSDGSVYFVGFNGDRYQVQRFLSNGQLDSIFGSAGTAVLPYGLFYDSNYPVFSYTPDVVAQVDAQGRLLIAGGYGSIAAFQTAIYRLTTTGQLDNTFSSTGRAITPTPTSNSSPVKDLARPLAMKLFDDGGVAVLIQNRSSPNLFPPFNAPPYFTVRNNAIAWWNADGTPRQSFGNLADYPGIAAFPNGPTDLSFPFAFESTTDDGFLVVGSNVAKPDGRHYQTKLLRIGSDGALDANFGPGGLRTISPIVLSNPNSSASMVRQPDGEFVLAVAGTTNGLVVTRFDGVGNVDTIFGTIGLSRIDAFGSSGGFPVVKLETDGSILVGFEAYGTFPHYEVLGLARLTPDGALDSDFESGGVTVVLNATLSSKPAFERLASDRIVVSAAGSAYALNLPAGVVDVRSKIYGSTIDSPWGSSENLPTTYTIHPPSGLPVDQLAELRYSLDFTNDGVFDIVDSTSPSLVIPAYALNGISSPSPAGVATYAVRAQVRDETGAFVDFLSELKMYNGGPSARIVMPDSVPEGSTVPVTLTDIIDSTADMANGLLYCLNPSSYPNGDYNFVPLQDLKITAAQLRYGPRTYFFTVRMKDSEGAFTDIPGSVNVANLPPTVGQLTTNSTVVRRGDGFQLTLANVADAGHAVNSVEAFIDDGDGLLDPSKDQRANYSPNAVEGTNSVYISAAYMVPGTYRFFARAVDQGGMYAVSNSVIVGIYAATIGSLTSSTSVVNRGSSFTLTANNLAPGNFSSISKVEFYRDVNNNGIIDVGTDSLLGSDTSSTGGWNKSLTTSNSWPLGALTFLARAFDGVSGLTSNTVSTVVTINALPVVGGFTGSRTAGGSGAPVTLTASNVSDSDGTITAVEIYLDSNNNGKIDPGTDAQLTVVTDTTGTTPRYIATTTAPAIAGSYKYLARAQDNRGGWSATKSLNFAVSLAPRIDGPFTASPNPVANGQTLTLTADNVVDDDGTVASVSFYRDVNGDGAATAADLLLGTDTSSASGWTYSVNSSSPNLITGVNRLLAVATDNVGTTSAPVLTLVTIDPPPLQFELDNTAATLVGSWTSGTSKPGFVGSNYQHDGNASKGTKTATYTPTLSAGRYSVSVNAPTGFTATNVPVDIYSNNVLLATVTWNQTVAGWRTLGTYDFAATGNKIVIRTNGTSGFVVIDAVRFTSEAPVTGPEVDVQGNGVSIIDGAATPSTANGTDLGSAVVGATMSATYIARNLGTTALSLGSITLPSGFSIDPADTLASSLAPGASDTFRVLVDTSTAGTKSGQISIVNDDSGENPYNFSVTATVTLAGATVVELDNTAATLVGSWTASTSKPGFVGSNYQHDGNASKGTKTATYTPTLSAGRYSVSVNAPTGFTATNVPVDIYSNNVLLATVTWNQTVAGWRTLGTFDFAATGNKLVIRTTGTSGFVVIDAVRFTPA
jgi:uncharacterized delta-60 repeat protein